MTASRVTAAISYKDLPAPTLVRAPFTRAGWVFELKYDGFRVLAGKDGGQVTLLSRRGTNLLPNYPEVAACLRTLPDLAIDGELVVLDEHGHPQFERLSRRLRLKRPDLIDRASIAEPAAIFAFDLMRFKGKDLRRQPLLTRKALLKSTLERSERIRYTQHIGEEGERLFRMASELGVEGIVAKRADSAYPRGRTSDWLKIKTGAGRAIDKERAKWNEE
jgi:bifunctional non-homologous end joining protein LigD